MQSKPIIALDFSTSDEIKTFLTHFKNEQLFVKVGMELYYQNGPEVVKWMKSLGHQIFLDLKLHDIPNTVERSMKGLAALDVDMINVHAAGGKQMMEAAMSGIISGTPAGSQRPSLIAVTQLTSTTQEAMRTEQLIQVPLLQSVIHYAKLTQSAGLDGVVCSALEAQLIKENTASEFLCVTPGIRPSGDEKGDQKRVATPSRAKEAGSSFIVVGRPITQSADPVKSYHTIKNQWNGVEE
ncbi:orotidine-5'-phosphate decarboxylase [Carnobacterium divergens]|uniref:Orotidine 5'-phosphate decarboxylase n=2 Tax=Carnobacterium divergens TaxID=2748 RepID=A0A0R2HNS0_CARDV|nr:orotidine-5'-phosphate decarboxylase [Carnobacterium divergens]KRN54296.1 orotidine 5-phosphate decarboxylase [Carnobacterium divergens DSM 20623]MDO0873783.1 orotidine-5'-phosphate decarboxylase [Carnobacterium divergens]MDT1957802.1 orotidine-5'-phosphate decarboxylase [Carnobacterium divergens]MDT1973805.1 orotidine-5'-phosphate decarboxylase [Carnobacterium divergens]TFJ38566.1 orotidine-5'-phosphate decarboxylase [Carnobacterium divergens]